MSTKELAKSIESNHEIAGLQSFPRQRLSPAKVATRPPGFFPVTVLLALCFAIPIYDLLRLAAADDLYSYIPLIPAISLYFVWLRRKNLPQFSEPMPKLAALFFAAGSLAIVAYWSAIRSNSPAMEDYLAFTLSVFLLFFAGICCLFLGREMVRSLAFPLCLLIFIIPLPVAARNWIETFLQHGSATVASGLFALSGMPVFQDGLKFQLPGFSLHVAPECSGIHSSLVLFITSFIAGYLFLRGPWKRAILVLTVIPLALLRNGFRIFVIGQLCVRVGPQMIDSPIHRHGGPLFFALSLIPLFGLLILFRKSEHGGEKFHLANFQKLNMKKFHPFVTLILACALAIAGNGCSAGAKKVYHSQRANRYFDSGEFDKAEIEFINVLHDDPQNADAFVHLGIIYFDEGRFQRAAPFLFRGSQLATNDLELRLKLGTIYLSIGKLKEARDEANFVLDKNPNDEEAPLLLAKAAATKADIANARQRLQQLSQNHDTAAFETASGILAFREHDFKTAAVDFHRAEVFDPQFAAVYSALGTLDWAQNDLTQAEAAFKTGAELSPPRSPNSVQYAQFEIQTSHLPAAKLILEDMTTQAPDYVPAWMGLAEIALTEKNYDDCATLLGTALARDPGSYDALLLTARLDLARGETAKAIGELEQLAKTYPQASRVQYQLAVANLVNGDVGKSIANLNRAVTVDPNFSDAVLLLAGLEIRNGNPNSAIAALKPLIQQQPQLIQAKLFLADAYRVQGDFNGALEIYQELEKSSPKNPEVPLLMGSALLQQKNNAAARQEFVHALELAPKNLAALEQLVDLDLTEKQYAVAMQRVEKSVEDNPTQAAPRILMAKVFVTEGNTNQAETALSKAIQLQPDSLTAYLLLAQLYFDSSQNQKALAELSAATAQNPTNVSVLMLTGIIHNQEKDYQGATDAYESLLKIDPKFYQALNNLAYIYSEHLDQPDKAYDLAQRARQLRPNDPSTADTLGWILFKKGQYSSAINLLQDSANQLPDQPDVHFHLGMAHYMMDDETSARAEFKVALESKTEFSGRAECAECLSVLEIDPKTATAAARAVLEKRVAEKSDDPVALARLAAIDQRDGISDKAIATYEAVLKADPKNVNAMIHLAQLYAPNNLQKASDLAKTAYNFAPDNSQAAYILGKLVYQSGNYQWAFSLLQQAAQSLSDNSEALYDFANAAYSIGKISDAQTAMQTALTLKPGLTSIQSNDAKRFLDLTALDGNPTQAVASQSHVQEILKLEPDYVPALMAVAVIAEQKKNALVAESTYEKILNRYPDFSPAQKQLAILYSENSTNMDRAQLLAQKAFEAFPDDPGLTKALGLIVFQKGDYGRAANLLRTAAVENTSDAELFFYLGMSEYNLKQFAESKTSLNRALTLNLAGQQTMKAKQLLAEIK